MILFLLVVAFAALLIFHFLCVNKFEFIEQQQQQQQPDGCKNI